MANWAFKWASNLANFTLFFPQGFSIAFQQDSPEINWAHQRLIWQNENMKTLTFPMMLPTSWKHKEKTQTSDRRWNIHTSEQQFHLFIDSENEGALSASAAAAAPINKQCVRVPCHAWAVVAWGSLPSPRLQSPAHSSSWRGSGTQGDAWTRLIRFCHAPEGRPALVSGSPGSCQCSTARQEEVTLSTETWGIVSLSKANAAGRRSAS